MGRRDRCSGVAIDEYYVRAAYELVTRKAKSISETFAHTWLANYRVFLGSTAGSSTPSSF